MSDDAADRELHDYLDGRLDEKERRTFEARIATDRDLAGRVAFYRDLGRVLRDAPSDLPTGFLGRARGRFEASGPRRIPRRRVLAWEIGGLAAAAVLVLAILFHPSREEPEVPDVQARRSEERTRPADAAAPRAPAEPDAQAPRSHERTRPATVPAPRGPEPAETDEAERKDEPRRQVGSEKALGAVASSALRAEAFRPRFEALPESAGRSIPSPVVISSPAEEVWNDWLAGPAGASLERLRPDFRSERVVLIGPRPTPFGCDGVQVVFDGGVTRIQLAPPSDSLGAPGGCAVAIPAGTSPVEIEDAPDAPR